MKFSNPRLCLTLLCVLYTTILRSQTPQIGDTLPSFDVSVTNFYKDRITSNDLKGKSVILDFWGQNCIACLEDFPSLDRTQQKFGDRLQIILINSDDTASNRVMFEKRKMLKKPRVPIIGGDTLFHKMFPHKHVPHQIWIDSTGVIRRVLVGTIDFEYLVSKFLSRGPLNGLDFKQKIFHSLFDTSVVSSVENFSYLARNKSDVKDVWTYFEADPREIWVCRETVLALYQYAFTEFEGPYTGFYRPGKTVVDCINKDGKSGPLHDTAFDRWLYKDKYDYHLRVPLGREENKYSMMRADIERYFGLNAKVEMRKQPCLVLVRVGNKDRLHTKGGRYQSLLFLADERTETFDSLRVQRNVPYSSFSESMKMLVEASYGKPFVDATNYRGNIDIQITEKTIDSKNLPLLRRELRYYGLDLKPMYWPIKTLVLQKRTF